MTPEAVRELLDTALDDPSLIFPTKKVRCDVKVRMPVVASEGKVADEFHRASLGRPALTQVPMALEQIFLEPVRTRISVRRVLCQQLMYDACDDARNVRADLLERRRLAVDDIDEHFADGFAREHPPSGEQPPVGCSEAVQVGAVVRASWHAAGLLWRHVAKDLSDEFFVCRRESRRVEDDLRATPVGVQMAGCCLSVI